VFERRLFHFISVKREGSEGSGGRSCYAGQKSKECATCLNNHLLLTVRGRKKRGNKSQYCRSPGEQKKSSTRFSPRKKFLLIKRKVWDKTTVFCEESWKPCEERGGSSVGRFLQTCRASVSQKMYLSRKCSYSAFYEGEKKGRAMVLMVLEIGDDDSHSGKPLLSKKEKGGEQRGIHASPDERWGGSYRRLLFFGKRRE